MKIDMEKKIMDAENRRPLIEQETKKPFTIRTVSVQALLIPKQGEDEEKFNDYEIFKKIRGAKKEVELTSEEVARIKKKIKYIFPPLILGQAYEILEGKI